ncbi:hypothetical protein IscW_ISCW023761, partial [Ixodes scapularis]
IESSRGTTFILHPINRWGRSGLSNLLLRRAHRHHFLFYAAKFHWHRLFNVTFLCLLCQRLVLTSRASCLNRGLQTALRAVSIAMFRFFDLSHQRPYCSSCNFVQAPVFAKGACVHQLRVFNNGLELALEAFVHGLSFGNLKLLFCFITYHFRILVVLLGRRLPILPSLTHAGDFSHFCLNILPFCLVSI